MKSLSFIAGRVRTMLLGSCAFACGAAFHTEKPQTARGRIFSQRRAGSLLGCRPIVIARHWDRTVLVLEDPGGAPLDRLLGHPLGVAFALRVAISLSAAIGHLHQLGLIHKDVKPANVLVNSVTGQCWLMGFAIASRLPRERQSPEPPEFVAGTLAYKSTVCSQALS